MTPFRSKSLAHYSLRMLATVALTLIASSTPPSATEAEETIVEMLDQLERGESPHDIGAGTSTSVSTASTSPLERSFTRVNEQ